VLCQRSWGRIGRTLVTGQGTIVRSIRQTLVFSRGSTPIWARRRWVWCRLISEECRFSIHWCCYRRRRYPCWSCRNVVWLLEVWRGIFLSQISSRGISLKGISLKGISLRTHIHDCREWIVGLKVKLRKPSSIQWSTIYQLDARFTSWRQFYFQMTFFFASFRIRDVLRLRRVPVCFHRFFTSLSCDKSELLLTIITQPWPWNSFLTSSSVLSKSKVYMRDW
jgi:hypothetical protein